MRIAAVALGAVALAVFASGLTAGFVSDAWIFLERADRHSLADVFTYAEAQRSGFYRPGIELMFWVEYRLFGLDPLPYHLLALACHLGTAALIGAIALHITRQRIAAIAAAAVVALALHAHEVVFDVADLHNALGGVLLSGAVYACLRRRYILAGLLAAALFTVDESGLLVLPIVALYELVYQAPRSRAALIGATRTLGPVAAVTVLYVLWRLTGGGFGNEVANACKPVLDCLGSGLTAFAGRFMVRPDELIGPRAFALGGGVAVVAIVLLLQPWRWVSGRAAIFGAGWAVGSTVFFLLALWSYFPDRLLYIPTMGAAIAIGALAEEAGRRLREDRPARVAASIAVVVVIAWIALGAVSLSRRGEAWTAAGSRARAIVEQTVALHPDPPPGATLVFAGVPHSLEPSFPPGNTGPYLYNNGLFAALWLRYDRTDITVLELPSAAPPLGPAVFYLTVGADGTVGRNARDQRGAHRGFVQSPERVAIRRSVAEAVVEVPYPLLADPMQWIQGYR
ncbi:MAG: hypothetical protein H0V04_05690 [Chloroflexi bacterium]|nr:hypothetical protein [Chloroflexota bacterium]